MQPALRDLEHLLLPRALHAIDKPVLVGDAARPEAGEFPAQRLRLALAAERVTPDRSDQAVDAPGRRAVLLLPGDILLPRTA